MNGPESIVWSTFLSIRQEVDNTNMTIETEFSSCDNSINCVSLPPVQEYALQGREQYSTLFLWKTHTRSLFFVVVLRLYSYRTVLLVHRDPDILDLRKAYMK